MPGGDRTGPMGVGPMTGRGEGFCAGYGAPAHMGRGGGRGWRHWAYAAGVPGWAPAQAPYAAAPTREQELDMLKDQAGYFEGALADLKKRIEELEAEKTSK